MPCELVEELVLGVGVFILILYEDDDDDELGIVDFVFVLFKLVPPLLLVLREEEDELCPPVEFVFVVDVTECCFWI